MQENPSDAGAGELLRIQAEDRMQSLADRIGARAEVRRTPQALVYDLSGTLADLDFLGWILREGLEAPSPETFEDARRRLRTEVEHRLETPQGVLQARARDALAPGSGSPHGSIGSLERMNASQLHDFWSRTHRAEGIRIVVAGRVPTALILASFGELGLPTGPIPPPPPSAGAIGEPRVTPQVVRHWLVHARSLPPASEAPGLVGARWIAELLRSEGGDFESAVELWTLPSGRALVLTGAAYPRGRQAMERRIAAVLTEAAARIDSGSVVRIAAEIRTEILLSARNPWGLAELVGESWDSGSGPEGVENLLAALDSLDSATVQSLLRSLAAAAPTRVVLGP